MLACGPGDRCHHINDEPVLVLQNREEMEEWWCKWNGGVNRMQKRSDMSIASVHFNIKELGSKIIEQLKQHSDSYL